MMNLLLSLCDSNHLRVIAAHQFCTNYARKCRFRILSLRPENPYGAQRPIGIFRLNATR